MCVDKISTSLVGHPARWNDKTIAHFDYFMKGIQEGHIFQDYKFELYDYDDAVAPKVRGSLAFG